MLFVSPSVDQHRRHAEVVSSSARYNGASRERFGMHWHDPRVLSPNAPEEIVARRGCSWISSSMGRRVQRLARPAGCVRHWALCDNRPMRRAQQRRRAQGFLESSRHTSATGLRGAGQLGARVAARQGSSLALEPVRNRSHFAFTCPTACGTCFCAEKKTVVGDAVFPAVLRRLPGLKVLIRTAF